jgi:hypothetical protein
MWVRSGLCSCLTRREESVFGGPPKLKSALCKGFPIRTSEPTLCGCRYFRPGRTNRQRDGRRSASQTAGQYASSTPRPEWERSIPLFSICPRGCQPGMCTSCLVPKCAGRGIRQRPPTGCINWAEPDPRNFVWTASNWSGSSTACSRKAGHSPAGNRKWAPNQRVACKRLALQDTLRLPADPVCRLERRAVRGDASLGIRVREENVSERLPDLGRDPR